MNLLKIPTLFLPITPPPPPSVAVSHAQPILLLCLDSYL